MALKSSSFKKKPKPWMYTAIGSVLATAFMKLSPIHRRLTKLEIRNIQDFFKSNFISPEKRQYLYKIQASIMAYFSAIRRMSSLTKGARQDYYALQRQGCFVVDELKSVHSTLSNQMPILIVPGLNTPTVFFREMQEYFSAKGYPVFVMSLPSNGLGDLKTSAEALRKEILNIQEQCSCEKINVIGHCFGGLIAHYCLEVYEDSHKLGVQNLICLGTGFLGADGVQELKRVWILGNPDKPVPQVFDELIHAEMNTSKHSSKVNRHSLLTIWDFMVHFKDGMLKVPTKDSTKIVNYIIEDPDIDHLTLALNHQMFNKVESLLCQ